MNNLLLNDVENIIKIYLQTKHTINSNGFLIRLSDNINAVYERRRSYIVKFPTLDQDIIYQIINRWTEYALDNIIENYDLNQQMTILSIDPLKFSTDQSDITIKFSGEVINPEIIIRKLSIDIIEQMNKHLIETYMDKHYPYIDMDDINQREEFNEIFDNIDLNDIYAEYPQAEVYVPLSLRSNDDDITFYINGTILTTHHLINIIDDIRLCLDSNNKNEIINYDKDDIVYKFVSNKKLQDFNIITDPQI
jgi:hypothetical protein